MTDEELRIKVAELCGWDLTIHTSERVYGQKFVTNPEGKLVIKDLIPDYCNDLNAMREAEKMLDKKMYLKYTTTLISVVNGTLFERWERNAMSATARQRA